MTQEEVVQALTSELPSTRKTPGREKLTPATTESGQQQQTQQRPRISFGGELMPHKQVREQDTLSVQG